MRKLFVCGLSLLVFLTASSDSKSQSFGTMSADQLRSRIIGNTMIGEYESGEVWIEYFGPNGELKGHDNMMGDYTAHYSFVEDLLCFDYAGDGSDWCGQVFAQGAQIRFIRNDEIVGFIRNVTIVAGNPMAL